MTIYSDIFRAFNEEAQFTKELLGIGVTQLYKANYASKGIYYEAFSCLSIGIERIGKLCLILDYYIKNSKLPDNDNYIRKNGHNIESILKKCNEISDDHNIVFKFQCDISDAIHSAIISVLNSFAKSSGRYANINILTGQPSTSVDCIFDWYNKVDIPLFAHHVTSRKKDKIKQNAKFVEKISSQFSLVLHQGEDRKEINTMYEASLRTGIYEAVAPYRQLYTLQIIRYFVEIIFDLQYKAMNISENNDIPFFSEIFALFYNSDSYFKSRKTWNNL